MTPMMQQFHDLKKKHPDALLLFRYGDFYETYEKDAEDAARILGITLTRRASKDKNVNNTAMAGFPYNALDTYLPKLIRAGKRVAICDSIDNTQHIKETVTPNKELTNKEIMTTETALLQEAKKQIIGIAVETIKALNGKVPTGLNKRLSDAIGTLEYIRLKYTNNATIYQDEMDYLLRLAEIGRQYENHQ